MVARSLILAAAALCAAAPAAAHAAGRPDLVVGKLPAPGVSVEAGSCAAGACRLSITPSVVVGNQGARKSRSSRLGLSLSDDASPGGDVWLGRVAVPALRRGKRHTLATPVAYRGSELVPGRYRLVACADDGARVRERREGNNCAISPAFQVAEPRPAAAGGGAPSGTPPTGAAGGGPAQACAADWRADLCALIRQGVEQRAFADMTDVLTLALLYQHLRTGRQIPISAAAAAIDQVRRAADPFRGQPLPNFRVRGYLAFWTGDYGGVDWARFPDANDSPEELASWLQTYAITQWTARQQAINRTLEAIVSSEEAWHRAMQDWIKWDQERMLAQQYSDAVVFAHRTLEDARAAVDAAQSAMH